MNITEAQAWHDVLRALRPDVDREAHDRAERAAAMLAERAHKALQAGPTPEDAVALVCAAIERGRA